MSFDDTGREPEQAFRLNRDPLAELEYPTKWVYHQQTLLFNKSCWCILVSHSFSMTNSLPHLWRLFDQTDMLCFRMFVWNVVNKSLTHGNMMQWNRTFVLWSKTRTTVSQAEPRFCFFFLECWQAVSLPLESQCCFEAVVSNWSVPCSVMSFFSPQDFSFFQCSAPLYPHPKELWRGEHQGLLHWPKGRILWGQLWLINKVSSSSLPLEP